MLTHPVNELLARANLPQTSLFLYRQTRQHPDERFGK
jgi:hypothetical protein